MPEKIRHIVTNTTPLIALTAATGDLEVLRILYARIVIDEVAGRRMARLCGLTLTGSIGILLKASSAGFPISMLDAIESMQAHGIWLSQRVIDYALRAKF